MRLGNFEILIKQKNGKVNNTELENDLSIKRLIGYQISAVKASY